MFTLSNDPANSSWSAPALAADAILCVGTMRGKFYALAPVDGREMWFQPLGNVSASPSIASDGAVIVESDDGKLTAFEP